MSPADPMFDSRTSSADAPPTLSYATTSAERPRSPWPHRVALGLLAVAVGAAVLVPVLAFHPQYVGWTYDFGRPVALALWASGVFYVTLRATFETRGRWRRVVWPIVAGVAVTLCVPLGVVRFVNEDLWFDKWSLGRELVRRAVAAVVLGAFLIGYAVWRYRASKRIRQSGRVTVE